MKTNNTLLTDLHYIEENPDCILKIEKPTIDDLDLAFLLKPELALNIDNIPEEVQITMIERDPNNAKYLTNPTKEVSILIVKKGYADGDGTKYYQLLPNPNYVGAWFLANPILL